MLRPPHPATRNAPSKVLYTYPAGGVKSLSQLSKRHVEVVALVAHGMSNREIGKCLGIKENTVKNHLAVLYEAVGIPRRDQGASPRVMLAKWYWNRSTH